MANIITVPNLNDPVMNADRARLSNWGPDNGWIFVAYNDPADHIAQITAAAAGNPIDVLDMDGHGSPNSFSGMGPSDVETFGQSLRTSTGFSANTLVYMDGCNTGLLDQVCIAQVLADAVGGPVFGSKGYLTGTYAEGNSRCYATVNGLAPYPGAIDATGAAAWNKLTPMAPLEERTNARKLVDRTSITLRKDYAHSEAQVTLAEMIDHVLVTPTVEFPQLRMAADATINYYRKGQAVAILDVFGNGALLRDRTTGETHRLPDPQALRKQLDLCRASITT